MSADYTYRICSDVKGELVPEKDKIPTHHAIKHKFHIQQRKGRLFKRWETVARRIREHASQFEMTDESGRITYRPFNTFEEAEIYLMQKFSGGYGNYVEKSGNIYEITTPKYYY